MTLPGSQLERPYLPANRVTGWMPATEALHGLSPVPFLFRAMAPHHHGAHTLLTGLLDRSALHGVPAEIEALGLDLLEVRQLTPHRESPESGDSRSP